MKGSGDITMYFGTMMNFPRTELVEIGAEGKPVADIVDEVRRA